MYFTHKWLRNLVNSCNKIKSLFCILETKIIILYMIHHGISFTERTGGGRGNCNDPLIRSNSTPKDEPLPFIWAWFDKIQNNWIMNENNVHTKNRTDDGILYTIIGCYYRCIISICFSYFLFFTTSTLPSSSFSYSSSPHLLIALLLIPPSPSPEFYIYSSIANERVLISPPILTSAIIISRF